MTTTARPASDPEIQAMNTIVESLEALEVPQRANVLRYINGRYGGQSPAMPRGVERGEPSEGVSSAAAFADLGDLFDKANPQNQSDRVLVVAYWKQVIEGAESFEAFPVSKELKHLGHGVTNITSALDSLIYQSPKLVLQVAKSGKSRQARKRYKVTREGVRRVQAMVNQVQDEGEGS